MNLFQRHLTFSGLVSKLFLGSHDIQEVECSGAALPTDVDLVTMVLHSPPSDRALAYVNLQTRHCSTSEMFVSCVMDDRDSRQTKLRALVTNLPEGAARMYGCNVTAVKDGWKVKAFSWSLTVIHQTREYRHYGNNMAGHKAVTERNIMETSRTLNNNINIDCTDCYVRDMNYEGEEKNHFWCPGGLWV